MITATPRQRRSFIGALACCILPTSTVARSAPPQWRLEPIAAVDGLSPDDPFGVIRGLALHADGRVVVTELNPKRVSMLDGKGRPLGMIGRIGGGPGEYRDPYSSAWLGDTLAVYDPGESRILYLTQGKTHLRSETATRFTGPDVRFFPVSRSKAYLQTGVREGNRIKTVYVGLSGKGGRDTVAFPELPPLATGTVCKTNGGIKFFQWVEAPRPIGIPVRADGTIAAGNTGEYDVSLLLAGKKVGAIARKDFVPAPLPDVLWKTGNGDYQKHVDQYGAASCEASPVRPPHVQPILAVAVADNGDVWVTARGKDEFAYNVFAADGRLLAVVKMPKGALIQVPIAITGDRLAYAMRDQDDVQSVGLARIVR